MGWKTVDLNGNTKTAASAGTVTESNLSLSDVTTLDVSTTKHGFAPKVPNDATKYLDGTGAYSVPSGAVALAGVQVTLVTITDAQFRGMATTPVIFSIAAPGARKAIQPLDYQIAFELTRNFSASTTITVRPFA